MLFSPSRRLALLSAVAFALPVPAAPSVTPPLDGSTALLPSWGFDLLRTAHTGSAATFTASDASTRTIAPGADALQADIDWFTGKTAVRGTGLTDQSGLGVNLSCSYARGPDVVLAGGKWFFDPVPSRQTMMRSATKTVYPGCASYLGVTFVGRPHFGGGANETDGRILSLYHPNWGDDVGGYGNPMVVLATRSAGVMSANRNDTYALGATWPVTDNALQVVQLWTSGGTYHTYVDGTEATLTGFQYNGNTAGSSDSPGDSLGVSIFGGGDWDALDAGGGNNRYTASRFRALYGTHDPGQASELRKVHGSRGAALVGTTYADPPAGGGSVGGGTPGVSLWASLAPTLVGPALGTLPSFRVKGVGAGHAAGDIVNAYVDFRKGEVPDGTALKATSGGTSVKAQLDVRNRWDDNSPRGAQIAFPLAASLAAGANAVYALSVDASPGSASPPDFSTLPAISVTITPTAGGSASTFDVKAAAVASTDVWRNGRHVKGATAEFVVPFTATGSDIMRLLVDVDLQADGCTCADVTWANDGMKTVNTGGTASFATTVSIGGTQVFSASGVVLTAGQNAIRRFVRRAGAAVVPPLLDLSYHASYLADAGTIHRPDTANGVAEATLAGFATAVTGAGWNDLVGNRGFLKDMTLASGRPDIGPHTMWQMAWLISGDPRAAQICLDQAETGANIYWHAWDAAAGGRWIDLRDHPGMWTHPGSGNPLWPGRDKFGGATGWKFDPAHQPDPGYIPYAFSGRRIYYREVQAQAHYAILDHYPPTRGNNNLGYLTDGEQLRAKAWTTRGIERAAWIAVDGTHEQEYMRFLSDTNHKALSDQIPALTVVQGANGLRGYADFTVDGGGTGLYLNPWQQAYEFMEILLSAKRGHADAKALADFAWHFFVEAWTRGDFNGRHLAGNYLCIQQGAVQGAPRCTTWAQYEAACVASGLGNNSAAVPLTWNNEVGNGCLLQAVVISSFADLENAGEAAYAGADGVWSALLAANPPYFTGGSRNTDPHFSVAPRGKTRQGT